MAERKYQAARRSAGASSNKPKESSMTLLAGSEQSRKSTVLQVENPVISRIFITTNRNGSEFKKLKIASYPTT